MKTDLKYAPFNPEYLPVSDKNFDFSALLKPLGAANRALSKYAGLLSVLENPMLLLSPFSRAETVASNKIEGTRVDTIDVLRADAGDIFKNGNDFRDLQEIRNYRETMSYAVEEMERRPFSLDFLRNLHGMLLCSVRGNDKQPGKFREIQNYIGTESGGIDSARFVPPDPLTVPALMDNWFVYFSGEEKDPIFQAAIVHAQFEMIHPFCDGNGRLGRMLLPLFFYQKKILPLPMFYLSRWFERFESEYKDALLAVSEKNDWTNWIKFFANAVCGQAEENLKIATCLQDFYRETQRKISENTRSSLAFVVFDAIVARPIFRFSTLGLENKISRAMLARILTQFERLNIIRILESAAGRRGALYVCPQLVNIPEQKNIF